MKKKIVLGLAVLAMGIAPVLTVTAGEHGKKHGEHGKDHGEHAKGHGEDGEHGKECEAHKKGEHAKDHSEHGNGHE